MGAASAVLGFGLGGWLVAQGRLRPVYDALTAPSLVAPWPSLAGLLGTPRWWVIGLVVGAVGFFLWRSRRLRDPEGIWPWWRNGLAIGVVGVMAWVAAAPAGWGYGLSMTGPTRDLTGWIMGSRPIPFTWGTGLVLGIPVGSYLNRRITGRFRLVLAHPSMLLQRFAGGIFMGVGGTLAAGCNIGNGLTALSILASNGLLAMLAIAAGRWAVEAAGTAWAGQGPRWQTWRGPGVARGHAE